VSTIRVATVIDAPPSTVWSCVGDISSHVEWMQDAEAIRFTSARTSGVGTTFDCDTKVGPIRLTDRMEITEWVDGEAIGVRHVGVVTGAGRFSLRPVGSHHTEFVWEETLSFPWWLAGPFGARVGAPVLTRIWRRNLEALKHLVESRPTPT
jgi:hypothetical protein